MGNIPKPFLLLRFIAAFAVMMSWGGVLTGSAQSLLRDGAGDGRQTASGSEETRSVTITLSGGVSKGSYQAGLNYGLLYLMRWINANNNDLSKLFGVERSAPPTFDLMAVTGASAGNINALLSAISWCDRTLLRQRVDESLFWDIWIPVGIEQLFPEHPPDEEEAVPSEHRSDFVFIRDFFDKRLFPRLNSSLNPSARIPHEVPSDSGTATPSVGCSVPFGITLTGTELHELKLAKNLPVPTMRYASLGTLQAVHPDSSRLEFRPYPFGKSIDVVQFGALALPAYNEGQYAREWMEFSIAASAFPVAFAPVRLNYRSEPWSDPQDVKNEGWFFDGGVFDNNPLDLAQRLSDVRRVEAKLSTESTTTDSTIFETYEEIAPLQDQRNFFTSSGKPYDPRLQKVWNYYIDPDWRRPERLKSLNEVRNKAQEKRTSLQVYETFIQNVFKAARRYELETLARDLNPSQRERVVVSDRAPAITGESYYSFGAFFSRMFREYDFYAGLYDAGAFMAQQLEGQAGDEWPYRHRELLSKLCLSESASELVGWLYNREHPEIGWLSSEEDSMISTHQDPSVVLDCYPADGTSRAEVLNPYIAIARAAQAWDRTVRAWDNSAEAPDDREKKLFTKLLEGVRAYYPEENLQAAIKHCEKKRSSVRESEQYLISCQFDPFFEDLLKHPSREIEHLTESALAHLLVNERENAERDAEILTELAYFGYRTHQLSRESGPSWSSSSMPSRKLRGLSSEKTSSFITDVWRFIGPNEAFFAARSPGGGIGYRPRYRPARWFNPTGVGFTLSGSYVKYGGEPGRFSTGLGVEWTPSRVGWPGPQNVEVRLTSMPIPGLSPTGLEISTRLLYGKLRVAIHQPSLIRNSEWESEDAWNFTIGLSDVNGMLYWFANLLLF